MKTIFGNITVSDLRGTWFEMGQQYGADLSKELQEVSAFVERILASSPQNSQSAKAICEQQVRQMPYTVRSFFRGAADTSGLTETQLHYANCVEYIAGLPGCSAVAAWSDYAENALVFGRNYDYGEAFLQLKRDVVVTVFHPADGSLAAAIVGYAGEIYAVNGINEKGLFIELNNGTPSTRIAPLAARISGTATLFDGLFQCDTLESWRLFFETVRCNDSYIINTADREKALSFEWCTEGVQCVEPEGLLVSTNHYVCPDWRFPMPSDAESWDSVTRRNNLLRLAESQKGAIDAERMAAILDTRIEKGGATDDLTVYQMIFVPETMTLWLKVSAYCDWTVIDIGRFLQHTKV